MPLAALIAAQDQIDSGDGLRATLPLAGRTLVERQAALAARAGAEHIVLLVERVPAPLAQAVDRLRRQGLKIEVARGVADAADRFHPHERILLVADGCVVAQDTVDRLAAGSAPALLVLPDAQDHDDFERIDGDTRWAGIALMDGSALHATVQMLGDWDLSSTLLRRLVQQGAQRIDALAEGMGEPPLLVTRPAAIDALETMMLRAAAPTAGSWIENHLHRLLAAPLVAPLIKRRIAPLHVALGAVALAWISALLAMFGYFWPALLLLPIAAVLASTERRMTGIWSEHGGPATPLLAARRAAALCVLAMIARSAATDGGWGWWLVAAAAPISLAGLWALLPIERTLRLSPAPGWIASADALVWMAPPITVLAGWRWMIVALACCAILSFLIRFAAVRREAVVEAGAGV